MARKETITVARILETAFAMTREEGFANVTARKVAARAGCSTQPIFRTYKNMEELWSAVYLKAISFFQDYYGLYPRTGKAPFAFLLCAGPDGRLQRHASLGRRGVSPVPNCGKRRSYVQREGRKDRAGK